LAIGVRLYREGLSEMLRLEPTVDVVGLAADAPAAITLASDLQPEIVCVDVAMPDGLLIVRRLGAVARGCSVVALGIAETDRDVVACAEAGVAGFITRDQSLSEAVSVVQGVARGELSCSARTAAALLRRVAVLSTQREPPPSQDGLTPREREIVELIALGRSNKQIARELCIELSTVKNHVHHVLEKLGVHRRAEAATRLRAQARA
jgi:two-component system nitrate/nitrite response regulator NarL